MFNKKMVKSIWRAPFLGVAIAAAVGIAAATAASAAAGPAPHCGSVSFAPQSDNGAFQIQARQASCTTARSVAGASSPNRFRSGDPQYSAAGFSCSGRSEQLSGAGKHVVRFRCLSGQSAVSFLRG